jgi:flagellar protein FliJ
MKRFAFRLQRVLDLRHAHEKQKLTELGLEQQRLDQERQKLQLFEQEKETQIADMRAARETPFSAWTQRISNHYTQRVARVVDFQTNRVHGQIQSVETARQRYLDARKDTRVMTRLKEKQLDEWQQDILREEGKILDEIGSRRNQSVEP